MPALAHTATSSGPNTEILLLGAGMIVLALVFFFQKSASRQVSLVLAVLGAVAITGAFTLTGDSSAEEDGGHDHNVSIEIASPAEGATVPAGKATVEIELDGGTITGDGAGHVHVYVDGGSVVMASSLDVDVELEPGEHEIEAEYVDAEHQPLDPAVIDSVTVTAE